MLIIYIYVYIYIYTHEETEKTILKRNYKLRILAVFKQEPSNFTKHLVLC